MLLIFAKILSVFSISLIGYAANKIKWLPIESTRPLSMLLVNISSPCLILYSMSQQELNESTVVSVTQVAVLTLLAFLAVTILSLLTVKIMEVPATDRGVYRALLVMTNNGFMGYPLALAVFGEKGLFLMIIANSISTIYYYSVGVVLLMSGREERLDLKTALKSIVSIPVIASLIGFMIFIFGIPIPELLADFLNTVGVMTIPLSMLVIGIQLAESKAREVLSNHHLYSTIIIKLIVFPAIVWGIFTLLPFTPFVLCIAVFSTALPSAAVIPVLAEIYDTNTKLAAQAVFITTMFSLITIPIWGIVLNLFLGTQF